MIVDLGREPLHVLSREKKRKPKRKEKKQIERERARERERDTMLYTYVDTYVCVCVVCVCVCGVCVCAPANCPLQQLTACNTDVLGGNVPTSSARRHLDKDIGVISAAKGMATTQPLTISCGTKEAGELQDSASLYFPHKAGHGQVPPFRSKTPRDPPPEAQSEPGIERG